LKLLIEQLQPQDYILPCPGHFVTLNVRITDYPTPMNHQFNHLQIKRITDYLLDISKALFIAALTLSAFHSLVDIFVFAKFAISSLLLFVISLYLLKDQRTYDIRTDH